jgi:UPF0176 protein
MSEGSIINASGYRFVYLKDPASLQKIINTALSQIGVKGAVLLALEGVNVNIAGTRAQVNAAIAVFNKFSEFEDLWLKESISEFVPHKRLKVRVRNEIIAFDGRDSVNNPADRPKRTQAPMLAPEELSQWMSENRPITLLDTRNDYEVESGTFSGASHLGIKHFRHFKQAVLDSLAEGRLDKSKAIVTFCTGGIRCEKAAPWLLTEGFEQVYQLEGGIINYLKTCSLASKTENVQAADYDSLSSSKFHWRGNCFVFDDRVELAPDLQPTGAGLCDQCQLAVPQGNVCSCYLGPHHHATYTINKA